LVLDDQNGELILPVVQNGRPDRGMPALNSTTARVADVAAFIRRDLPAKYQC
jgi:cytochrome c oxidase cbb3-type subunit 3